MKRQGAQLALLLGGLILAGCSEEGAATTADPATDLTELGSELNELGGGFGPGMRIPDLTGVDLESLDPALREHLGQTTDGLEPPKEIDGLRLLTWGMMRLPDDRLEDLLDSLIYPDEYTDEEKAFPAHLTALDGKEIAVRGYMIPVVWEEGEVKQLMLVGDLLACCFGIAPEPDQWLDVRIESGAEYFIQLPVVIKGTFRIGGIADEAGYAAGCYLFEAESLERVPWE